MDERNGKMRNGSGGDASRGELDRWKRLIEDLPEVRLDKVCTTRALLAENGYDDDRIIDETVRRLSDELGISHLIEDLEEGPQGS
jgi:hypothetical protein